MTRVCQIGDCSEGVNTKGLCRKHYRRKWKYGDPNVQKNASGFNSTKHPLYNTYTGMKQRCTDKNVLAYKNYGGRGIKVCDRWLGVYGFQNFVADMGDKPGKQYTLDRVDNDADYTPDNCKWSDWHEQSMNKRTTTETHGISYIESRKRWFAQLIVDGKAYNQYFVSKSEAMQYRKTLEEKYLIRKRIR